MKLGDGFVSVLVPLHMSLPKKRPVKSHKVQSRNVTFNSQTLTRTKDKRRQLKSELCFWFICLSEFKKKIKTFWEIRERFNQRGKESRASCARGRPLVEVMIIACEFM